MGEENFRSLMEREILDALDYCINCRFCLPSCPRSEITNGEIRHCASGITRSLYYAIQWKLKDKALLGELRDILYSCMTCKNCEVACKNLSTGTKLLDAIEKGRQLLVEEMIGPMPGQIGALESLVHYGNPYDMPPSKRKAWIKELNAPSLRSDSEVLLYVGCTAANDLKGQNAARALVRLLERSGLSFGVLEDEICCGHPALKMGEKGLFEEISERNLAQFKSLGVSKIVTLSPHCLDTFRSRYPQDAKNLKIQHYTQLLAELAEDGRLTFANTIPRRVALQDSCYLGRYNDIYEEPRSVLRRIPGLEVVEFRKSRSDSICCGGGGGRMWADFEEVDRLANLRVKEALEMDANLVVTACPWCLINFEDAVKVVDAQAAMEVKDLAELCYEAIS